MGSELQILQDEIVALKTYNNEVMAIVNSDTPLTHKIKSMLDQPKIRQEFLALLPDVVNKEQILRSEIQSIIFDIMQSPELQQCTPQSFLFSLKDSLARGLRIGSAYKEAWLVKFNNKKKGDNGKDIWVNEAKIMVGYRAYVNKAWNDNQLRLVVGTITSDELKLTRRIQTTNPVNGHIITEEVPCISFDRSEGRLEINIPLGKETKLHTKDNIEYVYVISVAPDGSKWSDLFTKEAIEEKSKVGKWEGKGEDKTKVYKLGAVWESKDRATDYKEMLHKGAIIAFSKMMPQRSLAELADFDHRQLESLQDVTPQQKDNVAAISAPTSAINDIIAGKSLDEQFNPQTGEITPRDPLNASIDAAMDTQNHSEDLRDMVGEESEPAELLPLTEFSTENLRTVAQLQAAAKLIIGHMEKTEQDWRQAILDNYAPDLLKLLGDKGLGRSHGDKIRRLLGE